MILITPYKLDKVIEILKENIDQTPSFLRCIITLNAHYYHGTSAACGTISEPCFALRNRKSPWFSLIAEGVFKKIENGTEIHIKFSKPILPDIFGVILFNRYHYDQKRIIDFLRQYLKAKEKV